MKSPIIKITLKISLLTVAVIILFQAAGLLFIYKYFKFDYYLSAVAIVFLAAGYIISKHKQADKENNHSATDLLANLTTKELAILQLITEGKSNKEIAAINFVEASTIKTHINNIYTKLGLNSRKQAIANYKSRFNGNLQSNIHPLST